ncbi:Beta-1,3-glucan-binding protein [Holothuria leucospilota]|uniref:Beta-1,3-glucan-binding protein n=1 Tax=Holothuria leucospilota TaxID=206669 RepID=A0A9Q1HB95_HOLLE|nr:Beta-1,3-glucan-binding protein [Holothuria leucospilota]
MVLVTSLQQVTTADRCPSSWISWGHHCYRYKMFKALLLVLLAVCACAYEVKDVDVSLGKEDQPRGVKFARAESSTESKIKGWGLFADDHGEVEKTIRLYVYDFVLAGKLIFEDTFDTFNLTTWQHEITAGGGGNGEFQYYTNNRSNSYVRDNVLYIKPTLTSAKESEEFLTCGTLNLWGSTPADLCTGHNNSGCERSGSATNYINPIQSARIRTVESFAFKYGKIEVEAQMPKGDWIWPAIWLLPKRNAYGQWPASGEIDLVEVRGNEDLTDSSGTYVGVQQMGQTLHWGPFSPINGYPKTHVTKNLPDGGKFSDAFYKFGLEWTADSLKFYLDNEETMTVDPGDSGFWDYGGFGDFNCSFDNPWANSPNKLAPFDQEFYIIINVAVGGTGYFSDDFTNRPYPKPWLNNSTHPIKDFYDAKCDWYPTWNAHVDNGEDAALKVRSVRVWAV